MICGSYLETARRLLYEILQLSELSHFVCMKAKQKIDKICCGKAKTSHLSKRSTVMRDTFQRSTYTCLQL
jgi:hypothetical protein